MVSHNLFTSNFIVLNWYTFFIFNCYNKVKFTGCFPVLKKNNNIICNNQ